MRACVALLVVASASACTSDNTSIRIERQPSTLTLATDDAWLAGGAVLVGEPGSFTFPQPIAVRITLIDPDEAEPVAKLISRTTVAAFDDAGAFEITQNPICQPTFCEAELRLNASGSAMLQVIASGADGEESDCFYYAVYEDADPAGATAAHYEAIEAKQLDCQRDLFD